MLDIIEVCIFCSYWFLKIMTIITIIITILIMFVQQRQSYMHGPTSQ